MLHQRVPSRHVARCPFRHFCCRIYRLATKCTTKKRSEKRHKCLYGFRQHVCMRVEKTRLVCQQWHGAVNGATAACRTCRCSRGVRTQIRSNCWIRGLTANGFFIQRSRCCDHNEYSVKILHTVRSAITAIAGLLVSCVDHHACRPSKVTNITTANDYMMSTATEIVRWLTTRTLSLLPLRRRTLSSFSVPDVSACWWCGASPLTGV